MLEQGLKQQVQTLLGGLNHTYTLSVTTIADQPEGEEMIAFLSDFATCSGKISIKKKNGNRTFFSLLKDNTPVPVSFEAIPSGHEFSSLLLLILNLDGKGKNFPDESLKNRIRHLQGEIRIRSFISLSCTNCPDVVQTLNMMAILNPNIHHTITDGSLYQQEAEAAGVQAVPSVFTDGRLLHVGRGSMGELLEKLEHIYGSEKPVSDAIPLSYDVIVVGGGPAGSSAAIYAARKGQRVALIADRVGGQILETTSIENLISVPRTHGLQLGADLKNHLNEYPVDIFENRRVNHIEVSGNRKKITTTSGEIFDTPALIWATGASWRKLNVPGEEEYIGSGIAFCTHCDGPLYKNKRVVVVGGGNSGLEAAIDLSSIATQVTLIEFADQLKGDEVLQEKLRKKENVSIITGGVVREVIGRDAKVTGIRYTDRASGVSHEIASEGIFIQIGLAPNSQLIRQIVPVSPQGEIRIDESCRTSIPGIYAAGDVTTVPYKQIIIAMGEGAKAALSAFEDKIKGIID